MDVEIQSFIERAIKDRKVYVLKNEEGYALSISNNFVNDDDELIELFCIWSNKKQAESHIKEEWSDYKIESISLSDFMEDWCIAISDQNSVAGLDFSETLEGVEVDTLELLLGLCEALEEKEIELKFKKFKSVKHLYDETKKAIKYE